MVLLEGLLLVIPKELSRRVRPGNGKTWTNERGAANKRINDVGEQGFVESIVDDCCAWVCYSVGWSILSCMAVRHEKILSRNAV